MRSVWTWIAGCALAILALGVAVAVLQGPWFTSALSQRYSLAEDAGLTRQQATAVAEQVRAFVVSRQGVLPAQVAGRPGFDPSAVSHLEDVADVMAAARIATWAIAIAVVVAGGLAIRRRGARAIAPWLRAGAILSGAFVLLAGIVAVSDFDAFFSAFHGLFFAEGTWTFPYDSLLIRLFPEPFWVTAGLSWALLVLLFGAGYWVAAVVIERRAVLRSA